MIYNAVKNSAGILVPTCRNLNTKKCFKDDACGLAHSCMWCGCPGHSGATCPVPEAEIKFFWPNSAERNGGT